MKKKYVIEVDDENEVLIKYTIEKKSLPDFLGMVVLSTNNVCGGAMDFNKELTEEQKDLMTTIMIEDSVYSALGAAEATFEVLASPVKKEEYKDGKYQEICDNYVSKSIFKELGKFVGYKEE